MIIEVIFIKFMIGRKTVLSVSLIGMRNVGADPIPEQMRCIVSDVSGTCAGSGGGKAPRCV
jgi:hypothetical protein